MLVRRMTIRKRMRRKLQEIKQQLRMRMHDPVPQTGAWLKSVVQGYFNYYAVPGNLDSLGLFRERVLRYWGQRFSAVVKYAGAPGFVVLSWPATIGFLHLVCSIPGPPPPPPLDRFAATHPR